MWRRPWHVIEIECFECPSSGQTSPVNHDMVIHTWAHCGEIWARKRDSCHADDGLARSMEAPEITVFQTTRNMASVMKAVVMQHPMAKDATPTRESLSGELWLAGRHRAGHAAPDIWQPMAEAAHDLA